MELSKIVNAMKLKLAKVPRRICEEKEGGGRKKKEGGRRRKQEEAGPPEGWLTAA